ncbi:MULTISPECIES: hypothetical protein [unclassified Bradyrhizobium]|uniref:hypothetical protein n=1 Tax=unclassified Bradyrhizobium TaxID=2631580 RepID=UPI001BA9DA55|nr:MULTISPECIES: hypothetical protein [unclassified Bradyrhizobium]MBR1206343.1 hypothetical protein [Bradyrhizobium sp. AUGA SZCCT0124]MBR1315679.1 hypothetical protein [Bradyrhizobium sp. AUGA SZCCT0051]MBR1338259.1 hypothetical protein [Bradyrhizobium sp. AUGA SZCCT0105]MBR1355914.1 hypothetical protein [Bradyrhizobium sp. AUGA SZCCT0045]
MSNRSAKFAAALAVSMLAAANFTAMAQTAAGTASTTTANAKTADSCQSAPKGTAPAGSHWFYHLDRSTKKQCWYLGDAKTKTVARTAATQQQPAAAAPDTATADATPPRSQPAPQPAMRKSVADAHAEWPSPQQAAAAPVPSADAGQAGTAATTAPTASAAPSGANGQSSEVNARWLDASSMAGTNGTRHAADQPTVVAQADPMPQQAAAPVSAAPVTAEASAEKSSSSTQMLLIVMVGALALAGLVSALVFGLTRTRTPPYEISDEWRAPWDSLHTEPAPPMAVVGRDRPLRLSEAAPRRSETPVPRRAETPAARRETPREADQTEQDNKQIAAMLQRLARSAAN